MPDFSGFRLGKLAARFDDRTLRVERYIKASLPSPPAECDNTCGIKNFGMMLNGPNGGTLAPDGLGCCTISALGHGNQIWSASRKGLYTLPDLAILQKYEQWCGYVNGDPSTDNGGVEIDVLNNYRKSGFWKHTLKMYADPQIKNWTAIAQSIWLFDFVYIGISLPLTAQSQTVWDVVPNAGGDGEPGSWGGHAVVVPKYAFMAQDILFTCITWGMLQPMTKAFWSTYVDEVHTLVSPEQLSLKTGETIQGYNLAQQEADLALVA